MSEVKRLIAGRYEIQALIGRGGMGEVYRAVHLETGQSVAIKSLKSEAIQEDPTMLERFLREGEALRQLNHPNIVKMLEAVEDQGIQYLVMEYVGGGSLIDLLKADEPLPIPTILQLALDLADALTRAHRLQIIHRDLKPANVLLTETGVPKLTDFGVARMSGEKGLTKTGAIMGTYSYLSPEAVEGHDLDARTDIWAFGIMVYEMLTGQRPFDREREATILMAILRDEVMDPSLFREDTPPALAELVMQMLEKDRDERISSARRVGAALEEIIESGGFDLSNALRAGRAAGQASRFDTPTSAAEPLISITPSASSQPPRSSSFIEVEAPSAMPTPSGTTTHPPQTATATRRSMPVYAGVGLVVLILLAIIGFLVIGGDGSSGGSNEAGAPPATATPSIIIIEGVEPGRNLVLVAEFEQIGGDEQDVNRFLIENLQETLERGAPQINTVIRAYPAVITSDEQAREVVVANNAQVIVWGNYTADDVEVRMQAGIPDGALLEDQMLLEVSTARFHIDNPRRDSVAAYVVAAIGLYHDQSPFVYDAVAARVILENLPESDAEISRTTVGNNVYRYFTNFYTDQEAALEAITDAIEINPANPMLYHLRATLEQQMGLLDQARQDARTAAQLAPQDWLPPKLVQANLSVMAGDLDTAIQLFDESLAISPDDWFIITVQGSIYYLKGDFEQAQANYERAIALEPETNFPYVLSSIIALREGQLAEVNQLMTIILTQFPDPTFGNRLVSNMTGGIENPNNFSALSMSAFTNLMLGQYQQAITNADAALAIEPLPDFYLLKGVAYCNLGDYEAAEEAYTTGIELDPDFVMLYLLRADTRYQLGNLRGALSDRGAAVEKDPAIEAVIQTMMPTGDAAGCTEFLSSE